MSNAVKWAVEVKLRPSDKYRRLKPRFKLHSSAVAFVTHGHPDATYRIVPIEERTQSIPAGGTPARATRER